MLPLASTRELFIQQYERNHEVDDGGNKGDVAGGLLLVAAFLFLAQCLTSFLI